MTHNLIVRDENIAGEQGGTGSRGGGGDIQAKNKCVQPIEDGKVKSDAQGP